MKYSCRGIMKKFKDQMVLENLDIDVPAGSIFLLLGLNGAGKTTLLKIIVGLLYPDAGSIDESFTQARLGFLVETPCFYDNLTAYQNLKHYAYLMRLPEAAIAKSLRTVGLENSKKKPVKDFSLGMKQRLGIARAIINDPRLLILDEPFIGLDPSGIYELKELLNELRSDGATIILSSHLIKEADIATDYAVLHNKSIAAQFKAEDIDTVVTNYSLSFTDNDRLGEFLRAQPGFDDGVALFKRGSELVIYNRDWRSQRLKDISDSISALEQPLFTSANFSQGTLEEYFIALTKGGDHRWDS